MLAARSTRGSSPPRGADWKAASSRHGVASASLKRSIFVGTLEGVVFPGLEKFGIPRGLPANG